MDPASRAAFIPAARCSTCTGPEQVLMHVPHLTGRATEAAFFHQVFQLCPLARHQELRCRAVQTGLIKLPDGRAEIEELTAQGLDFPFQRIIVHGDRARPSRASCSLRGIPP